MIARRHRASAVFLDRDGVIIEEVDYLHHVGQMSLLPDAASAIVRLGKAGFKVIVVTNQSVVARGDLSLSGLRSIHAELRRRLFKFGAKLDAIYFCPHHPSMGALRRCRCRKPAPGMLKAAARRFKLDLKKSYMVGDTTVDMLTARNAGCRAVLVKTGKGGRDRRYGAKPDVVCRDLSSAASWILLDGS